MHEQERDAQKGKTSAADRTPGPPRPLRPSARPARRGSSAWSSTGCRVNRSPSAFDCNVRSAAAVALVGHPRVRAL
jgi:hypothetical protein